MTHYNDLVVRAWDEWEQETGKSAGNPDDFVAWAIQNKKLAPAPQDVTKLLRKSVTTALRQVVRVDENGVTYRGKQCVVIFDNGQQQAFWFDTDSGGTPQLRKKAVHQRREGIANSVYRAMCDVEHMNHQHSENIQFVMDFTDDYEERKASGAGDDEDEEAA